MTLVRRLVKGQNMTAAEHDGNLDHFEKNPNGIYIPKAAEIGIKIDETNPDWGWRDLPAPIRLDGSPDNPSFAPYIGNIKQLKFAETNAVDMEFHIPHDYAIGTDVFIHVQWSHNSATVTGGTIGGYFECSYAKSFDQAAFIAPIVVNITGVSVSPVRYQHLLAEGQLSAAAGAGGLLDTAQLEPDGLILARLVMTANDFTGDPSASPFVHGVGIHYQSTNVATKNNSPDFYT